MSAPAAPTPFPGAPAGRPPRPAAAGRAARPRQEPEAVRAFEQDGDVADSVAPRPERTALFVSNRRFLGGGRGGVQIATAEFIEVFEAMGFAVKPFAVDVDRRLGTRLVRRLCSSPYCGAMDRAARQTLAAAAADATLVLVNQVTLAGEVVRALRSLGAERPPVVVLSHGAEITDMLHLARLRQALPLSGRLAPTAATALGATILDEAKARAGIDGVIAISPADVAFERWLGAPNAVWIPRTVVPDPLDWAPCGGRFGFVGTLDHAPNLEGLCDVLAALPESAARDLEIRIVGGPPATGEWLAKTFPVATYLGPLDDAALAAEARSWAAFLHPIFASPRGASTKLARPLAWGLPIVTTPDGRRGYVFDEGGLMEADTPEAFVDMMIALKDELRRARAREDVLEAARHSPSIEDVARFLRAYLDARIFVGGLTGMAARARPPRTRCATP